MYEAPEITGEEIVRTAWRHADGGGNDRRDRIVWAAGFIDADGSFGIYVQNKQRTWAGTYNLFLQAVQVNPAPLIRLQELFGGGLHHRSGQGKRRDYYQWVASGPVAFRALEEIAPYLVGKLEESEVAHHFWRERATCWNREMTPEERDRFESLRQRMMELKRRSYR